MNNYNKIHNRQSIRLRCYDYSMPGAYFITICVKERQCLLGNIVDGQMELNQYGTIAQNCWLEIPFHYPNVSLDEFVIMPNHMHGIIVINDIHAVGAIHELPLRKSSQQYQRRKMTIPLIIGRFKMNSAKQINKLRQKPGISVWQRNYYENIIRDHKSLIGIRQYIRNNPVHWQYDNENIENEMDIITNKLCDR